MNYKKIEGLQDAYPTKIEGTDEWYYCKIAERSFCDLYEAEELIKAGHVFHGMTCVLIHFPSGEVFWPFEKKENMYVDAPVFWENKLYFLKVDFVEKKMEILAFDTKSYENNI